MHILSKLATLQEEILDRVTVAALGHDYTRVARWNEVAKECNLLMKEAQALDTRISEFEKLVHDFREESTQPTTTTLSRRDDVGSMSTSKKAQGSQARANWVQSLHAAQGIDLIGHGTRYRTAHQASVGVAFANEIVGRPWPWFLGLPDEPTDIVVLLCKTPDQQIYDIVLPMAELDDTWNRLSRSGNGQVKFHVKKEGDRLLLSIPGSTPLTITQYKGNYRPLH
jgi:hypothetical protein